MLDAISLPAPWSHGLAPSSERREKELWGGVRHEDKTGPGHGRRGAARAGPGRTRAGHARRRHRRALRLAAAAARPQGARHHDEHRVPGVDGGQARQARHRRRQQDARGPERRPHLHRGRAVAPRRPHRRRPPRELQLEARHQRARLQRRRHRRRRLQRHLHQRRGRDAEEQAGRREPRERRAAQPGHRLDQEPDDPGRGTPAGSPTGRSSWSPATRASSAAASRPASPASASWRRRRGSARPTPACPTAGCCSCAASRRAAP